MGRKRDRTGIAGFFDDLDGKPVEEDVVEELTETTDESGDSVEKSDHETTAKPQELDKVNESNVEPETPQQDSKPASTRTPTPTGRPSGKKDGEGPLRTRTTLWIDDELMEAYRERVWEERCYLGELVERALSDYRNRNWGKQPRRK